MIWGRGCLPVVGLLLVLAACGSGDDEVAAGASMGTGSSGGMGHGSVECPGVPSVDRPPERVVTLDTGAAAVLIELGLGDRIVGTAGTDFSDDFTGTVRAKIDALEVLSPRTPEKETVLAARPDFVTGVSTYEFGAFDGSATVRQLEDNGAAVLAACDVENPSQVTGIGTTYDYITALAGIFGVEEKGERLVARLREEAEGADTADSSQTSTIPVLALTSVPDGGAGISTRAGGSLANGIITLAGGRSLAAGIGGDFTDLSAETVATADPQVIVAITGLSPQTPDELVASIEASPLLKATTAVRSGNVVTVPQTILLSPSVLNPQAVSMISKAVREAAG